MSNSGSDAAPPSTPLPLNAPPPEAATSDSTHPSTPPTPLPLNATPHEAPPSDLSHPIWKYFARQANGKAKCKVPDCSSHPSYGNPKMPGDQTKVNMERHLETHKGYFEKYKEEKTTIKSRKRSLSTSSTKQQPKKPAQTSSLSSSSASASPLSPSPSSTLFSAFSATTKWKKNSAADLQGDLSVLKMIIMDQRPFYIVNGMGFREMMAVTAPQYQLKSSEFYRERLKPYAAKFRSMVKADIKDVQRPSFTTDIWSTKSSKFSLMSLGVVPK